jgi:hypothetical protein
MSGAIDETQVAKLERLASVLIPGTDMMPAVEHLPGFGDLLRNAARACGYSEAEIHAALASLDPAIDWEGAKALAERDPDAFAILSMLASAAYYMAPAVLERLKFPIERRHPAEMEEFVAEYETGILDAVTERGPRYRDVVPEGQ